MRMRIARMPYPFLLANPCLRSAPVLLLGPLLLVAACSHSTDGEVQRSQSTRVSTPSMSDRPGTSSQPSTSSQSTPTAVAPPPGVPIAEAITWVEAGEPADAAEFRIALRGSTTTQLDSDTAFTTPAGTTCMTDAKHQVPALACIVNLDDPPPQPPDVYGQWKGGWVDFDGTSIEVGSSHGDPGRFGYGQGAPLPTGKSLSFGDYRCRSDESTLICLDYAHHSAVRLAATGVDAYGCAREVTPPAGIGIRFACG